MHAFEVISKKRDGKELTKEEIEFFVSGFTCGDIPDYQVAAFAMAVYFQGLSERELADLTMAMAYSGDTVDLSGVPGIMVDKHSTGGVGDKTTILLVPWIAAAGAPIVKMSGRGLGHTGGTIDKLESIPGFNPSISVDKVVEAANSIGAVVACQTGNLVPADKKLYAIRDVTGTVESIPLIASSVMSKKIAAGTDAIVLDVKVGSGAFMKNVDDARELARAMVRIGTRVGRKTVAVLSNMDQPLGRAVGNSIEVVEAIETLKGRGPADVVELCVSLGSQVLYLSGKAETVEAGRKRMEKALVDGTALEKCREMIANQGGDPAVIEHYEILPQAKYHCDIPSPESGCIRAINAEAIGLAAKIVGAGREKKDDILDLSTGYQMYFKVGDRVKEGESLGILYSNDENKMREAAARIREAYGFTGGDAQPWPMVLDVITEKEAY